MRFILNEPHIIFMTPFKEIEISEIGKVTLRKSARAKHISISIKPFKGVFITLPRWVSYLEGERILAKRIDWISLQLEKIKKIEQESLPLFSNEDMATKHHKIVFKQSKTDATSLIVRNNKIFISMPVGKSVEDDDVKKTIKLGIERALKIEAKNYLPNRIEDLAQLHKFTFNSLAIKNIKSRWGSCSFKNNINLSIHLMKLPPELIDYVLLHELVHTKVKNHSIKFWNELEKVNPNAKIYDKELRKYGKFIY